MAKSSNLPTSYHVETNSNVFKRDSMRALRPGALFLPRSPLKTFTIQSSIGTVNADLKLQENAEQIL